MYFPNISPHSRELHKFIEIFFCIACCRLDQSYKSFLEKKEKCKSTNAISIDSEPGTKQLEANMQSSTTSPAIVDGESSSMVQIQVKKRKNNEDLAGCRKKLKLNEPRNSCEVDRLQSDKNEEGLRVRKSTAINSLQFGCFYCTFWNNDINEIFGHWLISHKKDSVQPFLFDIDIMQFIN